MASNHSQTTQDAGRLAIRFILAVVFAFHGAQKLFGWFGGYGVAGTAGYFEGIGLPLPVVSTYLAGGVELVGGLFLLAGLGTRISAVLLSFTMLVASITAHSGFNAANGGFEYPLTLAVVAAGLALIGPGEWTVARLARGEGHIAVAAAR